MNALLNAIKDKKRLILKNEGREVIISEYLSGENNG